MSPIKIKVSLVIQLIDDYTNQPITSSELSLNIEGYNKPIHKKEGYYIFTNIPIGRYEVNIESLLYRSKKVSLTIDEPYSSIQKIRMIPSINYRLPPHTTCIEGRTIPFEEIIVVNKGVSRPYKLLYDYSNHLKTMDTIQLFHAENVDLSGRGLFIENKSAHLQECLFLSELISDRTYQLIKPLENSYKKIGTNLYDISTLKADEKGIFFLPMKSCDKDHSIIMIIRKDKRQLEFKIDIGVVNQINLLGGE